jgi:cell fate regulator YaaT (PSP1 superfamily)
MAKTQGLSLNPTKISGICGRLMCCLSYENEFYAEISAKMPKINARVRTKDGVGTVIYNNLLKQKVTVRVENDNDVKVQEYEIADIEVLPKVQPEQIKKDTNKKKDESKPQPEKVEQKGNTQPNKKKNFNNFKKKKNNNESK